jgi:phospholipase/lecithinase/hemolysin
MRFVKQLALGSITALLLAACGGGSEEAAKVTYSSVVSFGDSLSDPGAYKVGPIAQAGGGMFTVNGITGAIGASTAPSYVWPQLVAAAIVGTPSCAARMGFAGSVVAVPGCTNYAQGGSRVTDANGSGKSTGALTEPLVAQIQNFLALPANAGKFKGTELITVQGGANDMFAQADILTAAATAAGTAAGTAAFMPAIISRLAAGAPAGATRTAAQTSIGAAVAAASSPTVPQMVGVAIGAALTHAGTNGYTNAVANAAAGDSGAALVAGATADANAAGAAAGAAYAGGTGAGIALANMSTAGKELADAVKSMLANGAKKIVVLNIPDASKTPYGVSAGPQQQPLILAMTQSFNARLKAELAGVSGVLFVDAFAENQKQFATPAQFGLTNVTDKVCKVDNVTNPSGSSLFCNPSNVIAGDTSRYLFADGVHPTPYGHKLLAQFVNKELVLAGWL